METIAERHPAPRELMHAECNTSWPEWRGQLMMLRRLAVSPEPPEDFFHAAVSAEKP